MTYQIKCHERHLNFFTFCLIYFYEKEINLLDKIQTEKNKSQSDDFMSVHISNHNDFMSVHISNHNDFMSVHISNHNDFMSVHISNHNDFMSEHIYKVKLILT